MERKSLVVSGIQNPLCAGMRCGCDTAAERKASPKPKGFGGVQIGNYDTKRKTSIIDGGFSFGAPSGIRTRDPLIKSQLLYQLS